MKICIHVHVIATKFFDSYVVSVWYVYNLSNY